MRDALAYCAKIFVSPMEKGVSVAIIDWRITTPNKIQLFFVLKFRVSFKRVALRASGRAKCLSAYSMFVL